MERMYQAAAATLAATVLMSAVGACQSDMSAASRPRTRNVLTPENGGQNNALHRETEIRGKAVPTDSGTEFPGQSKASQKTDERVATLMNVAAPSTNYDSDLYTHSIPHLADRPPATPTPGVTPVENLPWVVENNWGEGLPLQDYPHRPWPVTGTTYQAAQVKHNPTYYFYFQDFVPGTKNQGTYVGDIRSDLYEIPWFYVNTAILPVLMVLQEPFTQVRTERLGQNPVFFGHVPDGGPVVPAPPPGVIKWDYPFLRRGPTAYPNGVAPTATSPTPGMDEPATMGQIPPTPGLPVAPPAATQP